MAGDKSTVKVTYLGDATALAKASKRAQDSIDGVDRQAKKSSKGIISSFVSMGAAAKASIAGVVGGSLVVGANRVFDMAASMELMDAKAKTVFGGQIGVVQKWAKANANAMGLTSREAVGLSANFADLLIPMGFTRNEAAKMSTSVVGLSGALARWSGGTKTAAEVSEILAKAMLGERDGLKELGISISEADVQNRLLRDGKAKLTGQALEQAKAEATQQLIMEKSTDAQAAYAKGTGTLAAKKAKLIAKVKEFRDYLVAKLIPLLQRLARAVVPAVRRAVEAFADAWGDLQRVIDSYTPDVSGFARNLGKGMAQASGVIIAGVKTGLDSGNWQPLGRSIGDALVRVIRGASDLTGKLYAAVRDVLSKVDWVSLGVDIGKQMPSLLVGLAAGILNFDLAGLLKGVARNWQDVLLSILAIAFTPARILGKVAEMLGKVPLAGPLLKWAFEHFVRFSKGLVDSVLTAVGNMGRAFVRGLFGEGPMMLKRLGEFFSTIWTWLFVKADDFRIAGVNFIKALGNGVLSAAEWLGASVRKVLGKTGDWIRAGLAGAFRVIGQLARSFSSVSDAVQKLIDKVSTLIGKLKNLPGGGIAGRVTDLVGKIPGFAGGTGSAPAGWAMVGEDGPELVNFGGGEQVFPSGTGPGGGSRGRGGDIYVTLSVGGSVISERDMVRTVRDGLADIIRNRGGDPAVIGA